MSARGRGAPKGRGRGRGRGQKPERTDQRPGGLRQRDEDVRATGPQRRTSSGPPEKQRVPPPHPRSEREPTKTGDEAVRSKTPQRSATGSQRRTSSGPPEKQRVPPPHPQSEREPTKTGDEAVRSKIPQQTPKQEDTAKSVVSAPRDVKSTSAASAPLDKAPHQHPQKQEAKSQPQKLPSGAKEALSKFANAPPPVRPGFGTKGREIALETNFFDVRFRDSFTVHHYDVSMSPAKIPKALARIAFEEMEKQYGKTVLHGKRVAYDGGANMYSPILLPLKGEREEMPFTLNIDGREKEFSVTLKYAGPIHINLPQMRQIMQDTADRSTMVQALDVVLRHLPSMRLTPIGRSLFPPQVNPGDIGAGLEVWTGHYQSLRPTMGWKLRLNIDTSATAFYKQQSVNDFMCEFLRLREIPNSLPDQKRRQLGKELKGIKIEVTHLPYPRKYRVNDVTQNSARMQTFPMDGKNETVENYFKQAHPNIRLRYPNLPCLHVGAKDRHVYIPMELCKIVPGQRCIKKLSDFQVSEMIKFTATPADVRKRKILGAVKTAKFNADPVLHDFGIEVSPEMTSVPGRVLTPPKMKYKSDVTVNPRKGEWDMRGKEFFEGKEINSWAAIVFANRRDCSEDNVRKFLDSLQRKSEDLGMRFHAKPHELYYFQPRDEVDAVFSSLTKQYQDLQLIIAVLDKRSQVSYNDIKHAGDNAVGIATQVVLVKNVLKCAQSTLANLCLKINTKLGGINSIILPSELPPIFREPLIVFGADVTHPSPGDTSKPSIASVVASMNSSASRYKALHRNQKHRQEIIGEMDAMVKELLIQFFRETRRKPVRIIFYRDGVSEGQFREVIREEVAAIQRACINLEEGYEPAVTFLVVQKRHHTRLFPVKREDEDGKGRNVPAGTIVDRKITHPSEFDFYLCSHTAIQGTSRPCHYHVLWDDNNFTADELQKLSYQLCHMFSRCNRSVSYPAPAYYAHRDAAHARCLLQAEESGSKGGGGKKLSPRQPGSAIEIHKDRKDAMYFV